MLFCYCLPPHAFLFPPEHFPTAAIFAAAP